MRVSYVWNAHECYIVKLNFEPVGMLFKTSEGWTFTRKSILLDDELEEFLSASFPLPYHYERLVIAKREISKKLRGWCR